MRYLVALGLLTALTAPMVVWVLADMVDRRQDAAPVSHSWIIPTERDYKPPPARPAAP